MNPIGRNGTGGIDLLEISLILVALTMPFENNLNSYAIVAFCTAAIFSNSISQKIVFLRQDPLSWILPALYFIGVAIHFFLDQGYGRSSVILETNASLLAFPVILGSMRKLRERSLKKIMISFVIANMAGSFYCFYKAYLDYKATDNDVNLFFYQYLSGHIGINAIYLSMYCHFSILTLLYYFFIKTTTRLSQVFAFLTIAYLSFFMILLSSKMFIFLLCLSGLAVIGHSFIHFHKVRRGALYILVLCITIPVLLSRIPYAKSRIEYTQVKKYQGAEDNNNGLAVRGVLWQSSWELIREKHGLTGMGHFSAQESLRQRYLKAGFEDGAERNYNSHNQYLYSWVCYGLISLLILLIFLFRFFYITIKRRTFLGIFLSSMFIVANITECMFETQKGIVFFLFFSGLLLFHKPINPSARNQR